MAEPGDISMIRLEIEGKQDIDTVDQEKQIKQQIQERTAWRTLHLEHGVFKILVPPPSKHE